MFVLAGEVRIDQRPIVRKLANANLASKVNKGFRFSC